MIKKSNATVVPLYFEGQNSRLFQIASNMSSTLRLSLLLNEVSRKVGKDVNVVVGKPISQDKLDAYKNDPTEMMEMLRCETYKISRHPVAKYQFGWPHKPNKQALAA